MPRTTNGSATRRCLFRFRRWVPSRHRQSTPRSASSIRTAGGHQAVDDALGLLSALAVKAGDETGFTELHRTTPNYSTELHRTTPNYTELHRTTPPNYTELHRTPPNPTELIHRTPPDNSTKQLHRTTPNYSTEQLHRTTPPNSTELLHRTTRPNSHRTPPKAEGRAHLKTRSCSSLPLVAARKQNVPVSSSTCNSGVGCL